MKYFVRFISNYGRDQSGKKSNYDFIICENHSPDISGMITLNKCFVLRKTYKNGYCFINSADENYSVSQSIRHAPSIEIKYRDEEETIIVNREDISTIVSIKDEDVEDYIPNVSQKEAYIKTEEELQISKIYAEKQMNDYIEIQNKKSKEIPKEIPKEIDNWFTELIKWIKI